jgi:sugar lactone lactonase YvrE
MKKFSFLAALVLPLFIASAASAQPAVISAITGLTAPSKILFTANGNGLVSDWTTPGTVTQVIANGNSFTVGTVTTPTGVTALDHPEAMTYDANGNLWIGNQNGGKVTEFTVSASGVLTPVTAFQTAGTDVDGITFDAAGNMYVADQASHVYKYAPSGSGFTLAATFTVQSNPQQVAVASNGDIWVTGAGTDTLNQYSSTGVLKQSIALVWAEGIAIDGAGNIWAGSELSNSISEYSSSGQLLQSISMTAAHLNTVWGLTIDAYGNIWVTDITGTTINKITGAAVGVRGGFASVNTTPDAPTNLAAATVGHTTMKLTWNYQTSPTTQFICTASNGATATVTGTSCSLKGFDLYNPGSYSFSVIAVVDGVQSDAAVLSVNVK